MTEQRTIVVPRLTEDIAIEKREIQSSELLVRREVREEEISLSELLKRESYDVQEVVRGIPVERKESPTVDGHTIVIPLYEEKVVIQRQLILKSELRITKRQQVEEFNLSTTVRHDHVTVERRDLANDKGESNESTSCRGIRESKTSGICTDTTDGSRGRESEDQYSGQSRSRER